MSRLPQPTRLLRPTSQSHNSASSAHLDTGMRTETAMLSPKIDRSLVPLKISPKPAARYQLQDPGTVVSPGLTKPIKRRVIRRPKGAIFEGELCSESRNSTEERVSIPTRISSPSPCRSRIPVPQAQSRPRQVLPRSPLIPSGSTSDSSRIPLPRPRVGMPSINTTPRPTSHSFSARPNIDQYCPESPSTPIQRPGPNSSTWRTSIQYQPSPVISICATVATATATAFAIGSPTTDPDWRCGDECDPQSGSESESEIERKSNFSSASRLAHERYRTQLDPNHHATPVNHDDYQHELAQHDRSDLGGGYDLSRISSTTSYSSASSLARHRLSQRQQQRQATPMSTNTSTSTQEMRLIWQPDLESLEEQSDPAENLWREIEARLNRRSIPLGGRNERGQWVLSGTSKQRSRPIVTGVWGIDLQYPSEEKIEVGQGQGQDGMRFDGGLESKEMKKEDSEFTISAYFDPDLSIPIPSQFQDRSSDEKVDWDGTALFNMSAPLISSSSSSGPGSRSSSRPLPNSARISRLSEGDDEEGDIEVGPTPANTPYIHYSTIQRVSRVLKSSSMSSSRSSRFCSSTTPGVEAWSRSRSDSSSAVVTLAPPISRQSVHVNGVKDESFHDALNEATWKNDQSTPTIHSRFGSGSGSGGMYRLDSHVVAVLEELSDTDLDIREADDSFQVSDNDQSEAEIPVDQTSYAHQTDIDESTPIPLPIPYHHSGPTHIHSNHDKPSYRHDDDETQSVAVGLGMGIDLHLDSIYGLPILPYTLPSNSNSISNWIPNSDYSHSTSDSSQSRSGSSITSTSIAELRSFSIGYPSEDELGRAEVQLHRDSENRGWARKSEKVRDWDLDTVNTRRRDQDEKVDDVAEEEEEEEAMLTVTDLDTGHRVDLSIKRLDELWIL